MFIQFLRTYPVNGEGAHQRCDCYGVKNGGAAKMFDSDDGQQCGNDVAGMVLALVFTQRTIQGLVADQGESQSAKHRDEEALGYAREEQ